MSSYSSILSGGSPNDVIGATESCYPPYCETGTFIFGNGDGDQWFIIELAHSYPISEITSQQSGGTGDREVWDLLEVLTQGPGGGWVLWGSLPGDYNIPNVVTFEMDPPIACERIKCRYGRYSGDWGGGGSRVYEVYAYTNEPDYPAFAIVSAAFDQDVYTGGSEVLNLSVLVQSNWGESANMRIAGWLWSDGGVGFQFDESGFGLGAGGQHVSEFTWEVPEVSSPTSYSLDLTLVDEER